MDTPVNPSFKVGFKGGQNYIGKFRDVKNLREYENTIKF